MGAVPLEWSIYTQKRACIIDDKWCIAGTIHYTVCCLFLQVNQALVSKKSGKYKVVHLME